MFDLITGATKHAQRHQAVPILISVVAHAAVAGTMMVGAVLFVGDQLPAIPTMMAFVAAPPAPPPPPQARPEAAKPVPASSDVAPVEPPPEIVPEAPADDLGEAEVAGGVPGGIVGGVVGGLPTEIPPPPPAASRGPIRMGGRLEQPTLVYRVNPVYPGIAVSAAIQGVVILEAIVDEEGKVESLKVLRSNGVLDRPALEAVRQWRYSPVLLNGRPEKFILTVVVSFRLEDAK